MNAKPNNRTDDAGVKISFTWYDSCLYVAVFQKPIFFRVRIQMLRSIARSAIAKVSRSVHGGRRAYQILGTADKA